MDTVWKVMPTDEIAAALDMVSKQTGTPPPWAKGPQAGGAPPAAAGAPAGMPQAPDPSQGMGGGLSGAPFGMPLLQAPQGLRRTMGPLPNMRRGGGAY
jgi:hypothetical protein